MANLILQSDQGDIWNANAYIDVPWFTTYHTADNALYQQTVDNVAGNLFLDSGYTTPVGGYTTDEIAGAIVRATSYLDKRFSYIGWRRYSNQPTAWPRWDAVDINDRYLKGIPLAVQQATAEYALIALQQTLVANPYRDPTGFNLRQITQKIGPLENQRSFAGGFQLPKYPVADEIMKSWGLIVSKGQVIRG